jgi:hypothetical protein
MRGWSNAAKRVNLGNLGAMTHVVVEAAKSSRNVAGGKSPLWKKLN